MLILVLVLLLLAALFGVLGAVLKAVAFLVITALLTITLLAAIAWWGIKRSIRGFSEELDREIAEHRMTIYRVNEAQRDPTRLPRPHDDRY